MTNALPQRRMQLLAYGLLVGVPLAGILLVLRAGRSLAAPAADGATRVALAGGAAPAPALLPHLPTLLLQVGIVILVARLAGAAFRRFKQPQVVGEMAAGIVLGPSVLGWAAPGVEAALFPVQSLGFLSALSQIGLVVFMFVVGVELNPWQMRGRTHTAVITSHASITLPFLLGSVLALSLYPVLSDDTVRFSHFALFVGTAMSVTAFPVLARILAERRLLGHEVGLIAIACAAVDDVTAWCILAAVVALVRSEGPATPLWFTLGGTIGYVLLMAVVIRPLLQRMLLWLYRRQGEGEISHDMMGLLLLLAFGSAWVTEWLGIHALFGAFFAGVVMPKDPKFVRAVHERIEGLVVVLLLPLFFAYTGLRTRIELLASPGLWGYAGLIILVAVVGKIGGSMVAARVSGAEWRLAAAVGILMNTRGLMELVVLNIGLDIGVISPALFTMMVLMALVTTLMTNPLLELVFPERRRVQAAGAV